VEFRLQSPHAALTVAFSGDDGQRRRATIAGGDRSVTMDVELLHAAPHTITVLIDGQPIRAVVARDGQALAVSIEGVVHRFALAGRGEEAAAGHQRQGSGRVIAPMPGRVLDVLVGSGEHIEVGRALLILEAMKMEHRLLAEVDGTVAQIHIKAGDMVDGAVLLLEITPDPPPAGA
jgi:acetyl/propionyl-CoA carboxylase alpha subunit